ncbi:hypothetical protein RN001_008551 [Aquatica leii]|uniref:Rab3 GTPase-activating protein catalytic subunit n=1 Tax=Aquatica leii TaxID=1421715 RepID=A0AAN7P4E1_9COLE|nr:hypothetical protein RN001_008551 [Aquatica leii]
MNEEIDESDFYHQDFTTASEWEVFIARLEEIVHQWKVDDLKEEDATNLIIKQGLWNIKQEKLQFVDVEFTLFYYKNTSVQHKSVEDDDDTKKCKHPLENLHDFVMYSESHNNLECPLAEWYGLNEFITLNFSSPNGIHVESQIKLLLSSTQLAINNTNCTIPIFVQIRDKWQNCYLGVYEDEQIRTNFEMIHLRKGPQHCQYLTGLVDLFKTKIMSPVSLPPITVSVQLTFHLIEFGISTWKQDLHDIDRENFDLESICALPFGVTHDPVTNLILKTTWSHLPDHLIVDSENYSDFDPMQAPKWSCYVVMTDQSLCLLSESLSDVLNTVNNNSSVYDILGDFVSSADHNLDNPLDLLTEPKLPTFSTVLKRAARNSLPKSSKGVAPLSEEVLVPILYFLFPDADDENAFPYSSNKEKDNGDNMSSSHTPSMMETECKGFKTCKENSLPWRIAIMFVQTLGMLGGPKAAAHLWFEFVQEMRFRWEKSIPIPGLPSGYPDPRTCLLNQKLQMLNCCIERKRARESRETSTPNVENQTVDPNSSTDDEEFYDCSPDKPDEEDKKRARHSLWNQPVGRLGKFENLKLIKTGDPLYIPITQDCVPKTEDQLEEDTDVLLQLGSDAQGSELRAKMMSASLLSDMESFKAANPGSILEDFIRWYSPRDWIEESELDEWGQKKGYLSSRMLISDNAWIQMWESAKPVPANRQKRLFDDTREAEKVLHFLDSRTLSQISDMLFSIGSHAAICRLYEECEQVSSVLPTAFKSLQRIIKYVEKISRNGKICDRIGGNLIQQIAALELCISQAHSLLYKLNPSRGCEQNIDPFVEKLMNGDEIEIEGTSKSYIGGRLITMFSEAQKLANMIMTEHGGLVDHHPTGNITFPHPHQREFVMRVSAVRPATYSIKSPQFLRTILSKNEFRLVGAFSEDVVFF